VDTLNLNGERVNPAVEIVPVSTNVAEEPATAEEADEAAPVDAPELKFAGDAEVRWFDGRPARPARQYWMTVTGYSPDERSCPGTADGLTATLHSVQTNNMKLVAADTSLLPYGSMLSIPGYDDQQIVPVLDCGGAIKGRRLDLLFPTHEAARKWGRQRLLVTVWEYCDGKPAENPRKLR
jgi:3D (Asp-Asp-Asp) domain-containing protein